MTEIIKDTGGLLHNFMIFEYSDVEPSKSSDGIVTMKGIIQKAQQPNANNRIYPRPILEREDAKYQELIKERRALGELDHPDSPIVQLENVSHLVTDTNWDGDNLMGTIEVLDFNLVCYDMVSNPSTSGAYMNLQESREYKTLVNQNRIVLLDEILNDILEL